jgi:flagellar motility protein MotE (MotC chaperone)
MKNIILIVGGSIASFLLILAIGVGILYMKPELFTGAPPADGSVKDSTSVKTDTLAKADAMTRETKDTTRAPGPATTQDQQTHTGLDTLLVAKLREKARTLEIVVDSLRNRIPANRSTQDSLAKSDWKTTAKLIESMSPEDAGKVLKQMSDAEVKQVISKVKTKQAGKILANLEPDRVARILR